MRARPADDAGAVTGVARVDRRTKNLIPRLRPGDVAVIDHDDLDRVAAEGLVEARVAAVVNAGASISGKYPNVGPLLVAAAGIPLVDRAGPEVMDQLSDGQLVRIEGEKLWANGEVLAAGVRQDLQSLEQEYEAAKVSLGDELARFAENTLEYMRRERHLVLESPSLPDLSIDFRHRQALVVVRGKDYRSDLAHLRSYIREMRPVLVAVDGGADALLDFGLQPDIIVGDFDSVSSRALLCGAQLVVHAFPGGRAPGGDRLDELGLEYSLFEFPGTSEDIALLLAYEKGAELIVAVGTHASMVEFLEKGRAGMASTFLVRLKVGLVLVDAKGVSQLYAGRLRKRDVTMFLTAAMLAFVAIGASAYPLRVFFRGAWLVLTNLW